MPSTTINAFNASTSLSRSFSTGSATFANMKQSTSNTFKEVRDEALANGLFRSFTHLTSPMHSQARIEFENGEFEDDFEFDNGNTLLRGVSCPVSTDSCCDIINTRGLFCDDIIEEEKSTNSDDNVNNDVEINAKSTNVQFESTADFASMNTMFNGMNTMPATTPVGPLAGGRNNNSPVMAGTDQVANNSMQSVVNGQSLAGFQFASAASCLPLSTVDPTMLSLNKPMQAGSQTPSTNTSTPRPEMARPLPILSQEQVMGMLGNNGSTNDSLASDECTSSDAGTNYMPNYSNPNILTSSGSMAIPAPMPFAMPMGFPAPNQMLPVFPPMGAFPGLPLSMLNSLPPMGAAPGAPFPGSMGAAPAPSMMPMHMPPVVPSRASAGQPLHLNSAIPEQQRASFGSMRMSTHSSAYGAPAPPAAMHPVVQKGAKGKGKQAPLGPGFSRSPANQITTPEGGKKETARHHFLSRKAKKMSKENGLSVQENYEAIRQEQEEVMAQKMFARSHQRTGNRGAPQQQKGAFYGKGYSKGGW